MRKVSAAEFDDFQTKELAWWVTNAPFDGYDHTKGGWAIYDQHFQPYYKPLFRAVADIGCGPVPHIIDPLIMASERVAIEPLFDKFMKVSQYRHFLKQIDVRFLDIKDVPGDFFDGVFCENMLDHCADPEDMLNELYRICVPGGRLYLFADVDKEPDHLHAHKLESLWLVTWLTEHFEVLLCKIGKSWKWDNSVLWFVGVKRES